MNKKIKNLPPLKETLVPAEAGDVLELGVSIRWLQGESAVDLDSPM